MTQELFGQTLRLFLRLGRGLLQDLDLAIDAQNFRHPLFELGVAAFQMVPHLMRFDFLLTRILQTVPWTRLARHPCPAAAPCSRAWRASRRVVHSSCG